MFSSRLVRLMFLSSSCLFIISFVFIYILYRHDVGEERKRKMERIEEKVTGFEALFDCARINWLRDDDSKKGSYL